MSVALCLALFGLTWPVDARAADHSAAATAAAARPGTLMAANAGMTALAMEISITPHFDAEGASSSFDAQARLTLSTRVVLRSIELHALDLQVHGASIDGVALPAPTVLAQRQRIRLVFARPLATGRHELLLRYRGRIGQAPQGLYRIGLPERPHHPKARTGRGQILATQMEPTDARRLAPMIDEPGVRLPYTLNVTVPAGLTVVANTEVVERVEVVASGTAVTPSGAGSRAGISTAASTIDAASGPRPPSRPEPFVTWRFAPTPPMPSYLIGLFIGEFDHVEDDSARPLLRVYTLPGKREQGRLALQLARELVTYYEDYFGQPYPLTKLDQIALPGGFEGGMENWGAVAYHESALLYDAASSPPDRHKRVWNLVSHELAHQWFGNLVTMAWWDDLWLNEAFANWMAARATTALTGDASVWPATQPQLQATMGSDALDTALPVIRPVTDDRAAFSSFDDITYNKGMAVVRALETRLGAGPFRDGLRRYMATHRLGNASAADLWQALEATSGRPVAPLVDAWLRRPGLPEVSAHARCIDRQTRLELTQRRFMLDPVMPAGGKSPMVWPLTIGLGRFDEQGALIDQHRVDFDRPQLALTLPGCSGALSVKLGGAGYYRVAYGSPRTGAGQGAAAPDEIDLLGALQVVLPRLPLADRVDLMGDAWAQVQAGALPAPRWMALVQALGDDPSPAVWRVVVTGLRSLDQALEQAGHPALGDWRTRVAALLRPHLQASAAQSPASEASVGLPISPSISPSFGTAVGTVAGPVVGTAVGTTPGGELSAEPTDRRQREAAEIHELVLAELGRIDDRRSVEWARAEWLTQARADTPGPDGAGDSPPGLAVRPAVGPAVSPLPHPAPGHTLSPALVGLIGRHADAGQFEQLRRLAGNEADAQHRSLLWSGLAGNRELMLARRAMALARSDEVPLADAPWLLAAAANAGHIDAAWAELRTHRADLMADLAEWDRAALAPAVLASATDARLADGLLTWTGSHLGPRAMPAARKAAGVIRVNAALARRVVPDLARWLGH